MTIDAIDENGVLLGDVLLEAFPRCYLISLIAIEHNISRLLTSCD